jgi:hypothetical protein
MTDSSLLRLLFLLLFPSLIHAQVSVFTLPFTFFSSVRAAVVLCSFTAAKREGSTFSFYDKVERGLCGERTRSRVEGTGGKSRPPRQSKEGK